MRRGSHLVAFMGFLWASAASHAVAEPIGACSASFTNLASYGPCLIGDGLRLDNITASVGGVDVSGPGNQLSMGLNVDPNPDESRWLLFNYPGAGEFPFEVSRSTPLEVSYEMTALDGATISAIEMALTNLESTGFSDLVEFLVTFNTGSTMSAVLGRDGEADRITRTIVDGATSMMVRTRVFGTATRGGGGPGFFAATAAPVPEPATMTLVFSGLAIGVARARRRCRQMRPGTPPRTAP